MGYNIINKHQTKTHSQQTVIRPFSLTERITGKTLFFSRYELLQKGMLNEEDVRVIPDIYIK